MNHKDKITIITNLFKCAHSFICKAKRKEKINNNNKDKYKSSFPPSLPPSSSSSLSLPLSLSVSPSLLLSLSPSLPLSLSLSLSPSPSSLLSPVRPQRAKLQESKSLINFACIKPLIICPSIVFSVHCCCGEGGREGGGRERERGWGMGDEIMRNWIWFWWGKEG